MSHERMLKAEEQLQKEINALLRRAEILDAQEDELYGKDKLGSDLPEELQRRQVRLEMIRQARLELEAEAAAATARDRAEQARAAEAAAAAAAAEPEEQQQELRSKADKARQKAEAARDLAIKKAEQAGLEPPDLEPLPADAMPRRGLAHRADGSPTAKVQRNFSDPDSHIMQSDGNWIQGYNCQAAVDGDHQVIVAIGVSNQPPDIEHLAPMLERTIANTGAVPQTFIADAGYWGEDNMAQCHQQGVDPYIATGRQKHGQPPAPIRGPIPRHIDEKERWPASCARRKAGRSTPDARRSWSPSLVRRRNAAVCGASCYAGSRR
jgi:hypothetical protein